jgi:hypothetical protein
MADDVTHTATSPAGPPDGTKQVTDEHATRGHMPVVKLAYSADGNATHVTADADGLLVNLGANNDVTVTGNVAVTNAGLTELAAAINASSQMDVNLAASAATVTVSATNLDIRDLTSASDSVAVLQATASNLNATVVGTGTFAVQAAVDELPAAAAITENFANPTTTNLMAMGMVWDGAAWDRAAGNSTDGALVNLGANNDVTVTSGSITATQATGSNLHMVVDSGTVTTVTTVTTATTLTGSSLAHDDADGATNPHKIGAKAVSSTEGVTLVAANDRTNLYADVDGVLVVKQSCTNDDVVSERVSNTDGASTAFTNFGAVASTHNCVSAISIFNSSASAIFVDFRDGTGGAVLFTMAAPAGGGSVISCGNQPYLFRTSQNTALAFDGSAAATTLYISVSGYQSKA